VVDEQTAERERVAALSVATAFADRHRDREETSAREVIEREVIRGGLGARAARADFFFVNELRLCRVLHVEELQDDAVVVGCAARDQSCKTREGGDFPHPFWTPRWQVCSRGMATGCPSRGHTSRRHCSDPSRKRRGRSKRI